ncbi:hypothetical protein [Pseudomonas costantinii]|uniref:Uncharacterized protein n=1 Tax=Pseudomonas costantinii TaxID=168469 RepID=A0A1S2V429_9PSED|nr:hypothetical protein [Pseudomonas costantinii]OIN52916.1 hypothetical protein BFL40_12505 [Pseudomonas costantinii]SED27910.1 hypothetical protein SAMN04515675_0540 [Pseudomonas costantinii]
MKPFIRPLFLLGAALYLGVTDYWFGRAVPALLATGSGAEQIGAFLGTVAWLLLTIAIAIFAVIQFVKPSRPTSTK